MSKTYAYDNEGNLVSDGANQYAYNSENKMILGTNEQGETSEYAYNALGARVRNVQTVDNPYYTTKVHLPEGSRSLFGQYNEIFRRNTEDWQPAFYNQTSVPDADPETELTKEYIVDYLSLANRDLMVYNEGGYSERYVYDRNSQRVSLELDYSPTTKPGEVGENLIADIAVNVTEKITYRTNILGSDVVGLAESGKVVLHTQYDEWGSPKTSTDFTSNEAGLDKAAYYTGYTYDNTLNLYYAQNRFYDPELRRFTQEDPIKSGLNWYSYVANNPINNVDPWGLYPISEFPNTYVELSNGNTIDTVGYLVPSDDLDDLYIEFYSALEAYGVTVKNGKLYAKDNKSYIDISLVNSPDGTAGILSASLYEKNIFGFKYKKSYEAEKVYHHAVSGKYVPMVNYEYFQKLMCDLGYNLTYKLIAPEIEAPLPTPGPTPEPEIIVYAEVISASYNNLSSEQKEANAIAIYHYLTDKGWTLNAIAGLLGNVEQEAKMNPAQGQGSGSGYGIVQWTPPTDFFEWSGLNRESADAMAVSNPSKLLYLQLDFIIASSNYSLKHDYQRWYSGIAKRYYIGDELSMSFSDYEKSELSAYDLAFVFHAHYERSNDKLEVVEKRAENAEVWNTFLKSHLGL